MSILGNIYPVKNNDPQANSNNTYYSVWVKYNGKPTPLLFTEHELDVALDRAKKNRDDVHGDIKPVTLLDQ